MSRSILDTISILKSIQHAIGIGKLIQLDEMIENNQNKSKKEIQKEISNHIEKLLNEHNEFGVLKEKYALIKYISFLDIVVYVLLLVIIHFKKQDHKDHISSPLYNTHTNAQPISEKVVKSRSDQFYLKILIQSESINHLKDQLIADKPLTKELLQALVLDANAFDLIHVNFENIIQKKIDLKYNDQETIFDVNVQIFICIEISFQNTEIDQNLSIHQINRFILQRILDKIDKAQLTVMSLSSSEYSV